jgi:hypothetical protein
MICQREYDRLVSCSLSANTFTSPASLTVNVNNFGRQDRPVLDVCLLCPRRKVGKDALLTAGVANVAGRVVIHQENAGPRLGRLVPREDRGSDTSAMFRLLG